MEIPIISDATQGLGLGKALIRRSIDFTSNKGFSVCDSLQEHSFSAGVLQVSALISPVDVVPQSRIRSSYSKTVPRTSTRKRRRTRRRSRTAGGDAEDCEFFGLFGEGGDFNGPFGGGGGDGGGGGGRGWNFNGFGGSNWEEPSNDSLSDPAFDVVYEVLSWIVLSNCLHFAFKKVLRIMADGIAAVPAREKNPMRLAPVC